MRKGVIKKFQGSKLKQARLIRNLTIQELAEKVGVSHQSISKYEKGKMIPSSEVLKRLSDELNFYPTFFYTETIPEKFYESSFIFRKRASTAKKYQNQLIEQMSLISLFIAYLETQITLPKFNDSLILKQGKKFEPLGEDKIINLATSVRRSLGLGDGPIDNMTLLCEKLGIIVVFADLSQTTIDGCSLFYEGRPYILLNNKKDSSVRRRFTLAHELGHILMHSQLPSSEIKNVNYSKIIEDEANLFASCLLMPESEFINDINGLGLDYMLILKKHWKISVQAMIFRAEYLEVFTKDYALYLRQQLSRKKWRTHEPYDDEIQYEDPVLIKQALHFLMKHKNIQLNNLAFDTGITEDEILSLFDKTSSILLRTEPLKENVRFRRVK